MRDGLGKRKCCWEFRINATPNPGPSGMATHLLCRYYGVCVCVCVCVCVLEKLSFHHGHMKNLIGRQLGDFKGLRGNSNSSAWRYRDIMVSPALFLHPPLSFSPPTPTITVGNLPCHQEDSNSMVNIPGKPNQKRDLRIKQKGIKRV